MMIVVMVAAGADLLLAQVVAYVAVVQLPFELSGLVCPVVLVWYIVTELGSIIENAVAMGAPVPEWLTKLLEASKKAIDTAGETIVGDEGES